LPGALGESYAPTMHGPLPAGTFTASNPQTDFGSLVGGSRYRVVQQFVDYDGFVHEVGETWTFLGKNFSPYDDGLSLFVSLDGAREWHIRLSWRPEDQGPVIDALGDYLSPG
jgi:hypothetical protein